MAEYPINFADLVPGSKTDFISGRTFGEKQAAAQNLISHIDANDRIVLNIDVTVKAINDSFIKGFFKEVFEKLKTKENVAEYFEINGDDYFVKLFHKNWAILESIYGDANGVR